MKTDEKKVNKQLNDHVTQNTVEENQVKQETQRPDRRSVFRRRIKYWMWVRNK